MENFVFTRAERPWGRRRSFWWRALLMGQAIAFLAASMNAASYTLVASLHVDTQLFQMFLLYILLSFSMCRRQPVSPKPPHRHPYLDEAGVGVGAGPREASLPGSGSGCCTLLRAPWWAYLLCSGLDIVPNVLALVALRYASLTSVVLLLGALTVPSTMAAARRLLGRRFRGPQYLGVCLCVAGGVLTVLADGRQEESAATDGGDGPRRHAFWGDAMAVGAALGYGLGDTVAEYFVKNVERHEYLGMLGLYGLVFTGLTFPIVEHAELRRIAAQPVQTQWRIAAALTWYVASVYLYYMTEAVFLLTSDATLLNLSLQAANLWAVLFSVVVDRQAPSGTFFAATALVVSGVVMYELWSAPDAAHTVMALPQEEQDENEEHGLTESHGGEVEEVALQSGHRSGDVVLPAIQLST